MKPITLTEEQEAKLLEMCKALFPKYTSWEWCGHMANAIQFREINTNNWEAIQWFEFCMTHLAEKIIATYITNTNGDKVYKRTLNDDLSKFYLESLNFSRGFTKTHPINYLYKEFKKINKPKERFCHECHSYGTCRQCV